MNALDSNLSFQADHLRSRLAIQLDKLEAHLKLLQPLMMELLAISFDRPTMTTWSSAGSSCLAKKTSSARNGSKTCGNEGLRARVALDKPRTSLEISLKAAHP